MISNQFEGGRKVTCKEANELLLAGKVVKIFWRPNRVISSEPDEDIALVWSDKESR